MQVKCRYAAKKTYECFPYSTSLSTVTGRKKRARYNLKLVVQRFCRGFFSVREVKNSDAGKGGDEKKGMGDDRDDYYFPICVVHRNGDAGETMYASKLV